MVSPSSCRTYNVPPMNASKNNDTKVIIYSCGCATDVVVATRELTVAIVDRWMYHTGKIVRKYFASPTVVVLDLHVPHFSFRPGQWVDLVVPPHDWIGGFSIASSPRDVPLVRLAVKRSHHPPAMWVHDHSKVHDTVQVKVGGSFVLDTEQLRRPTVFCAGGIGINPILSQYREFLYHQRDELSRSSRSGAVVVKPVTTLFLYSVAASNEFVFGEELADLSRPGGSEKGYDRMIFTLTQSSWDKSASKINPDTDFFAAHVERRQGRQLISILEEAPTEAIYYICGPPLMIEDAVHHLKQKGISSSSIKFEKWW
jgi:glycine betaine catabolism B